MNLNISKNSVLKYISGLLSGVALSFIFVKLKKKLASYKKPLSDNEEMDIETQKNLLDCKDEVELYKEQLKRNFEFFGDEGMKLISDSFVCVVGIGGVGSHVVMTLIRSGVGRIRVIDYDIVTLSSLNRHAFAFRSDVGKLKVRVVKEYVKNINPNIIIETVDDAFIYEYADKYILQGNPNYVVDCIDDLEAKCELLKFCDDNKLRVISSMGAGGKCDPTQIRVTDFQYVHGEKLAKRMRHIYKKKFEVNIPNFNAVYSIEKTTRGLSELEEHQKENPEMYRINENERIRSLPVFASIPAIFGQAIASVVLCDLANMPIDYSVVKEEKPLKEEMIGSVSVKKLYDEFREEIKKKIVGSEFDLVYEDFVEIAKVFDNISSLSQKPGNKTKFYKWNPTKMATIDNIVLISKSELNKHLKLKKEEDLIKLYGLEDFNRINEKLTQLGKLKK